MDLELLQKGEDHLLMDWYFQPAVCLVEEGVRQLVEVVQSTVLFLNEHQELLVS